jgi:hypothetical protein
MEIDGTLLLQELRDELEKVANAMMHGAEDWQQYRDLVTRGRVLVGMIETIQVQMENRAKAEGHV